MFFFEYIIKLLIGNSDSLFLGLIVVLIGYYGWLLWNINERFKNFLQSWEKHQKCLKELKIKMDELDESVYKELIKKLDENIINMQKVSYAIEENNNDMDRYRSDIIAEIKESAAEIKEIMKILMNNRSRSFNAHKLKDNNAHESKDNNDSDQDEECPAEKNEERDNQLQQ